MKHALSVPILAALLWASPALAADAPTPAEPVMPPSPAAPVSSSPDAVVQWNQILLGLQAAPGNQPATIHPTYELAVTHAAIYDAVVSIDRSGSPYVVRVRAPRWASTVAATDAAAHDSLVALYPSLRGTIDQDYAAQLAQLPDGARKRVGIRVGQLVAARLLASRANDGSTATPPRFFPGSQAGDYQLTPPNFLQPVFTHWRSVRPFVLDNARQFRPPAPPALTSTAWATAFNEVKCLGRSTNSTRTADQTQAAIFWNPPIWRTWNQIAETAAIAHSSTLSQDARTFALLNLSFADSAIAFYDAKYTYRFWRPVTAIQNGGGGNPATAADPTWTPLVPTALDPSYPGAHSTISGAGATVLSSVYGDQFKFTVTSSALPGVQRSFSRFSDAAVEAGLSRIYNGNHTRLDDVSGQALGRQVAAFVVSRFEDQHEQDGHER